MKQIGCVPHSYVLTGILFLYSGSCSSSPVAANIKSPSAPSTPERVNKDFDVVDGYPEKLSYFPGDEAIFYINSHHTSRNVKLDLYDAKGSVVKSFDINLIVPQTIKGTKPYEDGFDYSDPVSLILPTDINSGVYLLANKIPIIIKGRHKYPIVALDFTTMNAYSCAGGKSLYVDCATKDATKRARIVSFHRPLFKDFNLSLTQYFLQWALTNKMKFDYIADYEVENADLLKGRKLLIIPAHSEYWSRKAREGFDAFVNGGGNAAIFSGNTMWWQVRYQNDKVICYKAELEDPQTDPLLKTINWYEVSLNYPILNSIGADFRYGGFMNPSKSKLGYKIRESNNPVFYGTGLQDKDTIRFNDPNSSNFKNINGEYDGFPISSMDSDGFPSIDDISKYFYKFKLLGYDTGFRGTDTYGTFVGLQVSKDSGVVVNVSANMWTRSLVDSIDAVKLGVITKNIIHILETKPGSIFN